MNKKFFVTILALLILAGALIVFINEKNERLVYNFDQCAAKNYPVTGKNPRVCTAPNGSRYAEAITTAVTTSTTTITATSTPPLASGKVIVESPNLSLPIKSPLIIKGKAVGNWFFEANLPVKLLDANGTELARAGAQAKGEWMTTDYVPFEVKLEFAEPTTAEGQLIFSKDNPSGLPENDEQLIIQVKFR